jgi:hypothetical protein
MNAVGHVRPTCSGLRFLAPPSAVRNRSNRTDWEKALFLLALLPALGRQRPVEVLRMDRIHHDDAPTVFLGYAPSVTLTSSAVQGFKVLPTGNYRLEEVWLQR